MSVQSMLNTRGLYSDVLPDIQTELQTHPTLLVSWWATLFSLAIIVTRVFGRYVRIERFFPEDRVMMASVIPLFIRMGLVHLILLWGTNNTKTDGLTADDIRHREIGSRLVLAARVSYAIFIWTAKFTVCEFLKRVAGMMWRRSLQIFLQFIYYFLASTLIAVVIATLAECQPFDHYWQVVPDPGPQCRLGYANLITMGTCDVITDLLLVAFPIPLFLMTKMPMKRKVSLTALFALSLILVGITCYRVPSVIRHDGSQQYRSLLASCEILCATAVSNAVVIGSFVRDRGVKKTKFKKAVGSASVSESLDRSSVRRATITYHQWGSDSDLAGGLGIRLDPELYSSDHSVPRPAPVADPYQHFTANTRMLNPNWSWKDQSTSTEDDKTSTIDSLELKVSPLEYIETTKTPRQRIPSKVSIFDVGGLLDDPASPTINPNTPLPNTTQTLEPNPDSQHHRNGSRIFLQDIGGLLSVSSPNTQTDLSSSPQQLSLPTFSRPGGLAGRNGSSGRRRGSSVHFSDTLDISNTPLPSYRSQSDVSATILEGTDGEELQDVGGRPRDA